MDWFRAFSSTSRWFWGEAEPVNSPSLAPGTRDSVRVERARKRKPCTSQEALHLILTAKGAMLLLGTSGQILGTYPERGSSYMHAMSSAYSPGSRCGHDPSFMVVMGDWSQEAFSCFQASGSFTSTSASGLQGALQSSHHPYFP